MLEGRCSSDFGPTIIPEELASSRLGASTSRFSEIETTRDTAVEVCDVWGQVEWLTRVRCDDGTNPFSSGEEAHGSRAGNIGAGGVCGHIIDVYQVPCPERTYEIAMDMYVCTAREAD